LVRLIERLTQSYRIGCGMTSAVPDDCCVPWLIRRLQCGAALLG
jgi:hypothetical protein